MQKTPTLLLAIAGLVSGCQKTAPDSAPVARIERGVLGDTARFGPDIVRFNGVRTQATYRLASPGYVILLAVTPGKKIERIARPVNPDATPTRVGQYTTDLPLAGDAPPAGQLRVEDQAEYDRCIEDQRAAADRRRPKSDTRDSTGRVMPEGAGREESPLEIQRKAETACRRQLANRSSQAVANRPPYLALFVTDANIPAVEIDEWLDGFPEASADIPATLSAFADVLFRDRRAAWSGVYRRWW
jgi:hypothetical protein